MKTLDWESTYKNDSYGAFILSSFPYLSQNELKFSLNLRDDNVRTQDDTGKEWEEFEHQTLSAGFENHLSLSPKWKLIGGINLINIAGLAIGMTCCILILLWVQDEISYDRFQICDDDVRSVPTKTPVEVISSSSSASIRAVNNQGGTALDGAFHRISNFNDDLIQQLFTHEVFSLLLAGKLIGLSLSY